MKFYIYIISLDNKGVKTKFYGLNKAYYTGITIDLGRRIGDYLFKRGKSGWVNKLWKNARIIPVYVSYFEGTRKEVMKLERTIKKKSRKQKEDIINSEENKLVGYKPTKHLILKKEEREEVVYIR